MFKFMYYKGESPSEWKKVHVVHVHKKNDKQSLKNYIMFERIIYNNIFEYFTANNLISPNQSGFKPGDSCISQLLSSTLEIYQSFDNSFEVWGNFLDIAKAFDKVWHNVNTEYLEISLSKVFLKNSKQRVVLNGQTSSWANVLAGVPQKLILGPFFSWFISMIYEITYPQLWFTEIAYLGSSMCIWAHQWKMSFTFDPLKQEQEVIFSRKHTKTSHPVLLFNNYPVQESSSQKHLGMILKVH